MNIVYDCPAAKWLPARHNFALARLFAMLQGRGGNRLPRDIDRLALAIDRHQSAEENYVVSIWIFITVTSYIAALLPLPTVTAMIAAFPAALIIVQAPIYLGGCIIAPVWRAISGSKNENNLKINSMLYMALLSIASGYVVTVPSPARYVAHFFFGVVTLNAVASVGSLRNLIVGFAWLSPFILVMFWPFTPVGALVIVALAHVLLLYPTLRANAQWFGPVITRFETSGREVWLTIDDGPTEDTSVILDLLARREVTATFFVKGALAELRPEVIRSIRAAGHPIANHSYTHPSATFWCLPPVSVAAEIDRWNAVMEPTKYFRAPVGMKNPAVHPLLAKRGMRLVGWTARGFDTVTRNPQRIAARIMQRVEPGAIIVMHQGRPQSVACIDQVIDELQRAGYTLVIPADDRLKTNR